MPQNICPICKKQSQKEVHPFCSKRCAQVDLGNWLTENYRIETDERPESTDSSNG